MTQQRHSHRTHQAKAPKDPQGRLEDALNLLGLPQRLCLRDHPGHGYGQAGGGNHQQHRVDVIGRSKVTEALVANQMFERDLVAGAQDLDDGHRQRQHGGAAQEGLLLVRFSFQQSVHSFLIHDREAKPILQITAPGALSPISPIHIPPSEAFHRSKQSLGQGGEGGCPVWHRQTATPVVPVDVRVMVIANPAPGRRARRPRLIGIVLGGIAHNLVF